MEPENPLPPERAEVSEEPRVGTELRAGADPMRADAAPLSFADSSGSGLHSVFLGPRGVRAGWSVLIWIVLLVVVFGAGAAIAKAIHPPKQAGSGGPPAPGLMLLGEAVQVAVLAFVTWIVALIERRHLLDYNLRGERRLYHFATGLVFGFAALSALIGALAWGGWLHFGSVALSGADMAKYAAIWGGTFLLVGCFEEGTMRCYLLYTFTRGINFWWAAGLVGCVSALLAWRVHGEGVWGAYILALAGVLPCAWMQMKRAPSAGFWNAAWATSFLFGAGHTGNNGENWIGIFAAGAIGFVFCVSVRVTGSAWWAIGCHAAWDWGETYFYGVADSGLVAKGHLLTTSTGGNPFWSGGADGPEGSILVIPVILLLLAAVVAFYGRRRATGSAGAVEQAAG